MTFRLHAETGDLTHFTSAAEMFEHVLASMEDGEVHELTPRRRLCATPSSSRSGDQEADHGPA